MVHTDDFIIASKNPGKIMKQLQKVYTIKKPGPPSYLLGFDVTRRDNYWTLGSKTYVKAAMERIEKLFG